MKRNNLFNRRKQLNSAAEPKQLNSSVGTKQPTQQEKTTQLVGRNETTLLHCRQPPTTACKLPATAYDRLHNRLQPPTTAYKPPATAYNRLVNCLQSPAPPLQQNRLFLPTIMDMDIKSLYIILNNQYGGTATAGSDVVKSGRPIFDECFQNLWPYIGNNTVNVVFQMVKCLWLIRIDQ
ncbi:hypothetical protein TNCV_1287681 [Trichonephila clavipes]|nr:hypothetical protein TNCV_1287681 [Trichonephila clavipes]